MGIFCPVWPHCRRSRVGREKRKKSLYPQDWKKRERERERKRERERERDKEASSSIRGKRRPTDIFHPKLLPHSGRLHDFCLWSDGAEAKLNASGKLSVWGTRSHFYFEVSFHRGTG